MNMCVSSVGVKGEKENLALSPTPRTTGEVTGALSHESDRGYLHCQEHRHLDHRPDFGTADRQRAARKETLRS